MEFERGIWSAAMDGERERVKKFLGRGIDPSSVDSAGYTALVTNIVGRVCLMSAADITRGGHSHTRNESSIRDRGQDP